MRLIRNYLSLVFHVLMTAIIILSLPITSCVIFYNVLPNWVTIVISLLLAIPTIYWGIKYMFKIVSKVDFFEGQ